MRYICTSIVATLALAGTTKSDSEQTGGYSHHSISIQSLNLGEVVGQIAVDLPRNRLVGSTQLAFSPNKNGIFTMDLDSGGLQVGYSDAIGSFPSLAINTSTNTWYTYDQAQGAKDPYPGTELIVINGSTGESTHVSLPDGDGYSNFIAFDGALYVNEDQNQVYVVALHTGTPPEENLKAKILVFDGATNTWLPEQHLLPGYPTTGNAVSFGANQTTNHLFISLGDLFTAFDMNAMTPLHHVTMGGPISSIAVGGWGTNTDQFVYIACNIEPGHATLYEMNNSTYAIDRHLTQLPPLSTDVFWNPHDDHVYVLGHQETCEGVSGGASTDHTGVAVVSSFSFKLMDWVPLDHTEGSLCGNGTNIYASYGSVRHGDSSSGCTGFYTFEAIDFSASLAGDLDGDGDVDADDLNALHAVTGICQSDVNHDGATNIEDLLIMIEGWNSVCP